MPPSGLFYSHTQVGRSGAVSKEKYIILNTASFFHFSSCIVHARDVADNGIKTAKDLEHRCETTYKSLILDHRPEISVSGAQHFKVITEHLKLFLVFSTLRSNLMLPEDCPYLKAVTASIERKTGKKSLEEKYDLTTKTFGCIHLQVMCFEKW